MSEIGYFLNIDKPQGMTSRQVVDRVGRCAGTRRVGHAGTLDPLATGVLVIAVERATRLVEYVQQQPKTYEAEFLFGQTSNTDDIEGDVVPHSVDDVPTESAVHAALAPFIGVIEQLPPQYSALKVKGQPAYRLARKGQEVDLKPRPVRIDEIEVLGYSFPQLQLRIRCGSGTYIRSIARDLGELLNVGGVMSRLRRTAIGSFRVEDAMTLDQLTSESIRLAARPLADGLGCLDRITVDDDDARRFRLGQEFPSPVQSPADEVAVFDGVGNLLGIAKPGRERGMLRAAKGGFSEAN